LGTWIGIDYGTRRIGLAISDPGGTFASPMETLAASGSLSKDAQAIVRWSEAHEPQGFVIGLPLNMDGTEGPQAAISRRFADALKSQTERPVELWDERLTSFQADQWLAEAEVKKTRRKQLRDALAAQAILQSFLDARRSQSE